KKRTYLTSLPSRSRNFGISRFFSISRAGSRIPAQEIADQLDPAVLAFLRMKLGCDHVVPGDDRGDLLTILRGADHVARLVAAHGETVHEIERQIVLAD